MKSAFSNSKNLDPAPDEALSPVMRAFERFIALYPTEKHCIEEIIQRFGRKTCKNCGVQIQRREFGVRRTKCTNCRQSIWLLAGTFFDRLKRLPLHLACIIFQEDGITANAKELERLFGVAYSTCFEALKKLRIVAGSVIQLEESTVASKLFESVFIRRSKQTPAGEHPSAEQAEIERESNVSKENLVTIQAQEPDLNQFDSYDQLSSHSSQPEPSANPLSKQKYKRDLEKAILSLMQSKPISFEEIASRIGCTVSEIGVSLTLLELSGLVKRLHGDRYVLTESPHEKETEKVESSLCREFVSSVKAFLRLYFQGISRRYLQTYIAQYWMHVDRLRWNKGSLFQACISFGKVSKTTIANIGTELMVAIPAKPLLFQHPLKKS